MIDSTDLISPIAGPWWILFIRKIHLGYYKDNKEVLYHINLISYFVLFKKLISISKLKGVFAGWKSYYYEYKNGILKEYNVSTTNTETSKPREVLKLSGSYVKHWFFFWLTFLWIINNLFHYNLWFLVIFDLFYFIL